MEKPKDLYVVLGVPRNASQAAIKKAFRRLAREFHPDLGGVAQGSSELQALQAAYETLADAERRRRYDESLQQMERDRFAPLSWSFVRSPASGDLRRPTMPGSLSGEILLTPQEARVGGVLPLDVPLPSTCPACDGTGGFVFDCPRCGGEGKVERRLPVPIRIPANVPDGTVFQLAVDDPAVLSVLLTVHIRSL
jgi:DnaJ-class molecular chaperone